MVKIIWNPSDHGFLGLVKVALLKLKKSYPSLAIIVEMKLLHVYFSDLFLHVCYQKFTKRTMNVNWWKIQSCHVCLIWTARTYWNMQCLGATNVQKYRISICDTKKHPAWNHNIPWKRSPQLDNQTPNLWRSSDPQWFEWSIGWTMAPHLSIKVPIHMRYGWRHLQQGKLLCPMTVQRMGLVYLPTETGHF